jgi:acetoacetyl-CoA synthetase
MSHLEGNDARTAAAPADPEPPTLWTPDQQRAAGSTVARFRRWLAEQGRVDLPPGDHEALWRWSVSDLDGFWGALAEFHQVRFHEQPIAVLGRRTMPGAQWFPGATLNYAEHALAARPGAADGDVAVVFVREDGHTERLTRGQLREQVAAARTGMVRLGVRRGDRIVALLPNCPQALIGFLAAASLGAVWSSCAPEFGIRAVIDRFAQIEPTMLLTVDGYRYGGREFDIRAVVAQVVEQVPSLIATVLVDYLGAGRRMPRTTSWPELLAQPGEPAFEPVPFDHPLWILYSSGTTGLPKGIVQGHGGIVLEHLKQLSMANDLGPGEVFCWFTTTGWMMWNYLVSGLLVGATVLLYDGSPTYPDPAAFWRVAAEHRATFLGTSASYVQSCLKAELDPGRDVDLSALRSLGSTGSPLSPEGFDWLAATLGKQVQIASTSGGTDLCTAFVGASPEVPVWRGEISCRSLGAAVSAFDPAGHPVTNEVGELVVTEPMPSMPVAFWADPDGTRLREAYFDTYEGVWRHGDWIRITSRGSCVISGRSDATLNRGGVRMGTAEFYRVVETFPGVDDSLVVELADTDGAAGELLCFLVLADGVTPAELEPGLRDALRSQLSPRHVPDRFVVVDDVPRTLNGKKCEVPVKRILAGIDPGRAVSADALRNPDALAPFVTMARAATRSAGTPL